jgi:hypothetical protein
VQPPALLLQALGVDRAAAQRTHRFDDTSGTARERPRPPFRPLVASPA